MFSFTQGVAKLPFIDERRLLAETRKLEDTLTVCICYDSYLLAIWVFTFILAELYFCCLSQEEEKFRNRTMFDIIYVRDTHPLTAQIIFLYQNYYHLSRIDPYVIPIEPAARLVEMLDTLIWIILASAFVYCVVCVDSVCSGGMNGFLCLSERNWYSVTVTSPVKGFNGIAQNRVL